MIVDTHCHAWRRWPYDTSVPDPGTRGSVESLLYEMDRAGVDHAAIVCARIGGGAGGDGFANDDNNEYVIDAVFRHPDRLTAWLDVDCAWSPEYHRPGSAGRLREALQRSGARGFTHYVAPDNDGWMRSDEGAEFFDVAAELGAIASLALTPAWFDDLSAMASARPSLPILLHHMAIPSRDEGREHEIGSLLRLARHPSVGVKISGFNYNATRWWEYPYPESVALFRRIFDAFGPDRLYWGSDFPASRDQLTYRQSIEVVRTHAAFLGENDLAAILGGNAARLLSLTP
ncbi:amidohydrolase family protein [Microbacterium sp. KR10-403]|uniref:amidohydrolase family protein n=1 Tax=Microbacterium sp. KR10-403 TaxID=3158581 RepID=UPI0032E417C4